MLPPEVNSGRMYAGPGSGPMIAAATAWDDLAAELQAGAASYSTAVSGLTTEWQGPSSAAMAAAAGPYVAWLKTTAAQAEQTANQARAAAASYETAFAATVPPPVIAANRSMLMSLIATNILGQNTAAIAATEAQYAEMWAQDSAAMYDYAGSSATASALIPFEPPPQTTKPDGTAGQTAAVAQATGTPAQALPQLSSTPAVPQALQTLAAPAAAAAPAADPPSTTVLTSLSSSFLNATIGPYNLLRIYDQAGSQYDFGVQNVLLRIANYNMQTAYGQALSRAGLAGVSLGGAAVSAGMGRAGVVGALAVPPGWASAAPAIRPVAAVLPGTSIGAVPAALAGEGEGSLFSNMALSGLAGRAAVGTGGGVARSISPADAISAGTATTATIIVIPED